MVSDQIKIYLEIIPKDLTLISYSFFLFLFFFLLSLSLSLSLSFFLDLTKQTCDETCQKEEEKTTNCLFTYKICTPKKLGNECPNKDIGSIITSFPSHCYEPATKVIHRVLKQIDHDLIKTCCILLVSQFHHVCLVNSCLYCLNSFQKKRSKICFFTQIQSFFDFILKRKNTLTPLKTFTSISG